LARGLKKPSFKRKRLTRPHYRSLLGFVGEKFPSSKTKAKSRERGVNNVRESVLAHQLKKASATGTHTL